MDNARTLSGQTTINADIISLPETINAITIKGNKGLSGQVLQKSSTNKLGWGFIDDIEIPDGSISGAKLKSDIGITTTGDIQARNITATNILKTETTLDLPNTITAINITDGGGNGSAYPVGSGQAGTANRGGGGGGGVSKSDPQGTGGAGGKGVVIVKF